MDKSGRRVRSCGSSASSGKGMYSPANFICRLVPRQGVRVSAFRCFHSSRSNSGTRSHPVVEYRRVARGVRMGRCRRGDRRHGGGRVLRHLYVRPTIVPFLLFTRRGELMNVTRDLNRRNRCRNGLDNNPVGTRLRRSLLPINGRGEVSGLICHLVRGTCRPRGRCQREVSGRPLRRLFVGPMDRATGFKGRTGRLRANYCRVKGRSVPRRVNQIVRPVSPDKGIFVRPQARRRRRRIRGGINGSKSGLGNGGLGKPLLRARVDGQGTRGDVRYRRCGRRSSRVKVVTVFRGVESQLRGHRTRGNGCR